MEKELLEYFKGDELAASTWLNKYALRDENDNILEKTPNDMHKRLAVNFARIEEKYKYNHENCNKNNLSQYGKIRKVLTEEKIFELFKNFKYIIPAGSVMYGLGLDKPISLSNCFVIASPEDNISGIFNNCAEQANLFKRRGGVGFDISSLRPKGAKVNNSAHFSTGSVSFMDLFSQTVNTIGEHGRRGALMLSININHPDVLDFILKKQDLTKVTGANISVQITDRFMQAVEKDEDYLLTFPITLDTEKINIDNFSYDKLYCIDKEKKYYIKKIKAKNLWNTLIHCAWNTAEPGLIFQDTMINYAPDGVYKNFKMVSTNPCAEIAMEPYNSCRLIHLNLTSIVKNPFMKEAEIDKDLLYTIAYEATILGDDLIDLEIESVEKILNIVKENEDKTEYKLWDKINKEAKLTRRCGIGFTGLSDVIAMLNYKYDSDKSLQIIQNIMKIIFEAQLDATIDLAIERGIFEGYNKELELKGNKWYDFVKKEFPNLYERMMKFGRRNLSFSTVAPTGTVSLMAQCSSGIEPLFMPYYIRRRKCLSSNDRVDFIDKNGVSFTQFIVLHPTFKRWIENKTDKNINELSQEEIENYYQKSPWYNSIASNIDWKKRIQIQQICQKYITHSISSTINLPKETTEEEISEIYWQAWKLGNKGQTVYRDSCRDGVLVSLKNKKPEQMMNSKAPKRPKELKADYYEIKSKGKIFAIIIGLFENRPYEIFAYELEKNIKNLNVEKIKGSIIKISKGHYQFNCDTFVIENLLLKNENIEEKAATLYISMLLRHGVDLKYIIKTAKKVNNIISSFSSAICRVLSKYMQNEILIEKCPECGGKLIRENGCIHCVDCGYSKCL